jgi:SAM-dependent methyltransferase
VALGAEHAAPVSTTSPDTWTYRDTHLGTDKAAEYEQAYAEGYYADEWAWFERPFLVRTFSRLRTRGTAEAADFACGTGRVLRVAADVFPMSFGLDISPDMLKVAAANSPTSKLLAFDASAGTVREQFDVVSAFRFFLNAEDSLRASGAAAMYAMLRPGGSLVVNTHSQPWSPLGITKVMRRVYGTRLRTLSARSLCQLLRHAGFTIDSVTYHGLVPRMGEFYPGWYRALHRSLDSRPAPRWLRPFAESAIIVAHRPR